MPNEMLKKNQILSVTIEDLTHDGSGIAKIDGYPLFIPAALPGEEVRVKVVKVNKKYGFGRIESFEKESPERVTPPCPVYQKCGGCQLQHLSYEGQLLFKRRQVEQLMKRVGKLETEVLPTIGMAKPFRYRNKSQVPVGYVNGKLGAGFYQKRSHDIIDMDTCLIQDEKSDAAIQEARAVFAEFYTEPYNEVTHQGDLRHIMTRVGKTSGELMLVLITRTLDFPNKPAILEQLKKRVQGVTSIVQNINANKTNVILGDKTVTLYGPNTITDTIHGIQFAISARSFYQVNPEQTEVLYQKALDAANLTGNETVIDAYCGIGSISLCLAKKARHVYGVEIVNQAILDARANAKLNQIENVTFETGKAEDVIPNWYKNGITADVLVVDPPRKGCDEKLLATILKMKPKKVVYVSCDPATLARDLRILNEGGYKVSAVQPVDMFPMTTHIENVVSLEL
ncbi:MULTISPECIES: 23S rRNA (uracil(1939)-C(5))-methyltransferase RlmD [unclassified Listeria]|uniref:23S rRNA (uracil(1939)-C(5))-methyltransferase RlmD n=1 Tax=unclassified Listeria TaxID=2642072 RepID=UPI000B58EB20|nr:MULTISPECIES: 23S rRNA (uracil(1939)-C(5))-methyltransferase RlmD [unclassified Listeria]